MRLRRPLSGVLLACALLTGCTTTVPGSGSPADGLRTDVSDAELTINLAADGETDRIARNALADVLDFWQQAFPREFGQEFGSVEGGFWSIDPDTTSDDDLPADSDCFSQDVDDLAENAFYCPDDDAVYYDRAWMSDLADQYGPFMIAEIVAHEMGHAVQTHAGIDDAESIVLETQAECFAGSWTRWVVDGHSRHFTVRAPALDPYLLGYLYFGDPVGTDPGEEGAHGSLFDQLSAFQEGYADGPPACAAFDSDRLYTEREFDPGDDTGGDLPYDESVDFADDTLAAFWEQAFSTGFDGTPALGGTFTEPPVRAADGSGMVCSGQGEELDLEYCPEDGSVRYDSADLLEPAYDDVGDFAVDALLSLPYGLAARQQLGLSVDDAAAVTSVVCASGWYARALYTGDVEGSPVDISPGDVDEAAVVLLLYATKRSVLPDAGLSGFELADYFRRGFVEGGTACRLG